MTPEEVRRSRKRAQQRDHWDRNKDDINAARRKQYATDANYRAECKLRTQYYKRLRRQRNARTAAGKG